VFEAISASGASADAFANRLRTLAPMDFGLLNKGRLGGWGIDTRDPTADRRLIELCLRIPVAQYLRGGRTRALARAAFADRLPPVIVAETRKGFQAADGYEGFTRARAEAARLVERLAGSDAAHEIFDVDRMRRLVADWPAGDWTSPPTQIHYRFALLRGLAAGHFLTAAPGPG
jgi:asparagine synthase (glutamine-hydrolysing)